MENNEEVLVNTRSGTYIISTAFLTESARESEFSIKCGNVLNALAVSTSYPQLNAVAVTPLETLKIYNDLLMECASDRQSKQVTDRKNAAKQRLIYEMYKLVWGVMLDGNNDPQKMTHDTGLSLIGPRRKSSAINTAPLVVKTGRAVPFDHDAGTVSLPVLIPRGMGRPAGTRGMAYRIKFKGEEQWSQPFNFANNRDRRIKNLQLGQSGVFQLRYNGGSSGNGPWSKEFFFIVA